MEDMSFELGRCAVVSSGRCKESKKWREESQDELRMHYQWLIVGSKSY